MKPVRRIAMRVASGERLVTEVAMAKNTAVETAKRLGV
jgi:hypothetical protein